MKKVILFLILILVVSCSPFTLVDSTTYNNADLSAYKTFRIVTPNEGKLPPGMGMVTYYNIAAAIREQMVDRGFTESENAPLLVNIAITVKNKLEVEPALPPPGYRPYGRFYPYYMYPRRFYWRPGVYNPKVITGIYKEGVLTMEMVDMQRKEALYSSSVSTILEDDDSQFRDLADIAEAVKTLFSNFPVKLLPQYQKKQN